MSDRVLELLRKAVAILEDESVEQAAPTPLRSVQPNEDEVVLEGTIGRPELRTVGDDIPLFVAGLRVRTPEGQERWISIQAWRKVALFADGNLDSGTVVRAIGRWETQSYTTRGGEQREKTLFSVRLFEAA